MPKDVPLKESHLYWRELLQKYLQVNSVELFTVFQMRMELQLHAWKIFSLKL